MSNRLITYAIICSSLLFIQASCKSTNVGGTADCPKKPVEELSAELRKEAQKTFDFYYSKVGVTIKDSKTSNSFKASIKMRPDSAIAGTVKVAGIMGAAYLIDQDTFAYKYKINKCYKKESFNTLTEMFGTEITYKFVQQLMLGQAVGVEKLEMLYPLKNDNFYVLASHDRKVYQRMENSNLADEEQDDIFVKYTLSCVDLQLLKINISIPKDSLYITIDFNERQMVEFFNAPKETRVKIVSPEDSLLIELDYGTTTINEFKKINLSIPDSYSECKK